jgi:Tfp pilus assembly protein FimT
MNDAARRCGSAGFTIVELMVVILIISLAIGMITILPNGDRRDADVSAAAQELAGTLREARALAMDRRCITAVSFNIQNAPGTSGRILNNNTGGHWYRIAGPVDNQYTPYQNGSPVYPYSTFWNDNTAIFLNNVKTAWVGDRHVLVPRHVRFLALSDQDNGTIVDSGAGNSPGGTFLPTYPRPWCGWWDAASQRLYPWGGYDPAIVDANGRQCSGFYFAGRDGTISGCVNPVSRSTTTAPTTTILTAGDGRALIHGDWLDYIIHFLPDGTAHEGEVMRARQMSWAMAGQGGGTAPGDFGDFCGQANPFSIPSTSLRLGALTPMTSYVGFTGFWSITLAPDQAGDDDHFPSAMAAYQSLMPAYRVMVSPYGLVKVVKIRAFNPGGAAFDTTISNWQDPSQTNRFYQNQVATDAAGNRRGMPMADFLMPEAMANRTWWLQ